MSYTPGVDSEALDVSALSSPRTPPEYQLRYLVTGGSGFFGRHLVETLVASNESVRVFDMHQSFENEDVEFQIGDIRDPDAVRSAVEGCSIVFHVASMTDAWGSAKAFHDVNVKGTQNVIDACIEFGVERLVYTSTGSVVIDGTDIKMGDESLEYPRKHLDVYSSTKAEAEKLVIAANGRETATSSQLWTCSLRPHAMFGPRDNHFVAQLIAKAREGDITHYIGDGQNVCDFTYVANAVHAHILAAKALRKSSPVCGNCYFITNGEPIKFWDFIGTVLRETGCVGPTKSISFRVAYTFAYVMEFLHWLLSWFVDFRPTITRHMVSTMACHHWFSHSKATRDFGYRPVVSLEAGLEETIAWFQQIVRNREEANRN